MSEKIQSRDQFLAEMDRCIQQWHSRSGTMFDGEIVADELNRWFKIFREAWLLRKLSDFPKVERYSQMGSGMVSTFRGPDREPAGDWVESADYDRLLALAADLQNARDAALDTSKESKL